MTSSFKQEQKVKVIQGHAKIVERLQRKLITTKLLAEEDYKKSIQERYKHFMEMKKIKEEIRNPPPSPPMNNKTSKLKKIIESPQRPRYQSIFSPRKPEILLAQKKYVQQTHN